LVLPPSKTAKAAKDLGRRPLGPAKTDLRVQKGELARLQKPVSEKKIEKTIKLYNRTIKEMRTVDWVRLQRAVRQLSSTGAATPIPKLQKTRDLASKRRVKPENTLEFLLIRSPNDSDAEQSSKSSTPSDESATKPSVVGSVKYYLDDPPACDDKERWNEVRSKMGEEITAVL
jgi:hypothetical protein